MEKVYKEGKVRPSVFPTLPLNIPNENGPQFYDDLFDECRKNGMELLRTISHYKTPLHLAEQYNGWFNRAVIGFYEKFARTLFARFGKR